MIRAVSLDAAGTIIQIKDPVASTYAEIANRHGIPIDAPTIDQGFRTNFPRMSPLAFGSGDRAALRRQERDWWRTLVRNCLGRFGQHRQFNAFFDELYQHYAQASAWRLFDDVRPLLSKLEASGITAIVVSNFDSRLDDILRSFEIRDAFCEVLCSSRVGSAKPDARIFSTACTIMHTQPSRVLHVGDDRQADYEGAKNAGLQARWLEREPSRAVVHEQIASLGAVLELLQV